ncbi:hypothetical protein BUALT_Bualt05G0138600 [Buddleja alternifolia]|uniref:BHLH domain-containing protein n=1 Tax=Buddleja alternifolia TaxID=168488 RepID=A0AAV6XV51_9LAMI|nr:hypothetical protein BUALT_Bualt05G0138600 [Buddleja alternifolia]
MKSGKGHQEEEEDEDEEFGTKKESTPSNNSNAKDGKNSEKANAMRSKHSVTEQRRRSKINERFQILRELIPDSEQKRDTASFLLEVIQYVQFLQEKVQKYEGPYQPWSSEATKLMPWRNSHWRGQSFSGQPQTTKNGSGPGSTFPANHIESDPNRDVLCQSIDPQSEPPNKALGMPIAIPLQAAMPVSITNDGAFSHSLPGPAPDAHSTEIPAAADNALNGRDDLTIEGGTISIASAYSQGLLNSFTQALQSTGVDLAQATISVQINLGKQANRGSNPGISIAKDHDTPMSSGNQPIEPFQDPTNNEDFDQAQKRRKI